MKLALLGHGRMGRVIAAQARAAGHEVAAIVTSGNAADAARLLPGHDVAIDFSVPAAVPAHAAACAAAGVPLVEGTTGWHEEEAAVRRLVAERRATLVYGPNFSIGVNLFYRVVAGAARPFPGLAARRPLDHGAPGGGHALLHGRAGRRVGDGKDAGMTMHVGWLRGCGTALVTPFTATGGVDVTRLEALVERQVACGVRLLVPCG